MMESSYVYVTHKYLLNACYVPGTILDAEGTAVHKAANIPCPPCA